MGDGDRDPGDIAEKLADVLIGTQDDVHSAIFGWEITGLDIGEIEVVTPEGQRFRLVVTEEGFEEKGDEDGERS